MASTRRSGGGSAITPNTGGMPRGVVTAHSSPNMGVGPRRSGSANGALAHKLDMQRTTHVREKAAAERGSTLVLPLDACLPVALPWASLLSLNAKFASMDVFADQVLLGRKEPCDLQLPHQAISGIHARIYRKHAQLHDQAAAPRPAANTSANAAYGTGISSSSGSSNDGASGVSSTFGAGSTSPPPDVPRKVGGDTPVLAPKSADANKGLLASFAKKLSQLFDEKPLAAATAAAAAEAAAAAAASASAADSSAEDEPVWKGSKNATLSRSAGGGVSSAAAEVWLEDLSTNGTFLAAGGKATPATLTRVGHGNKVRIRSGTEITLLPPGTGDTGGGGGGGGGGGSSDTGARERIAYVLLVHGELPSGDVLEAAPPEQDGGDVVLCFTDIESSTSLWEGAPAAMNAALERHDVIFRTLLARFRGYEVKTEGDAFMIAFFCVLDAVRWTLAVQEALLHATWPAEILALPSGRQQYAPTAATASAADPQLVWNGLRVRMGIHVGQPSCRRNPVTGRMVQRNSQLAHTKTHCIAAPSCRTELILPVLTSTLLVVIVRVFVCCSIVQDYFGNVVNKAARVSDAAHGGQVVCTIDVYERMQLELREQEQRAPKHNTSNSSNNSSSSSASSNTSAPAVALTPFTSHVAVQQNAPSSDSFAAIDASSGARGSLARSITPKLASSTGPNDTVTGSRIGRNNSVASVASIAEHPETDDGNSSSGGDSNAAAAAAGRPDAVAQLIDLASVTFVDAGFVPLKGIAAPVHMYSVTSAAMAARHFEPLLRVRSVPDPQLPSATNAPPATATAAASAGATSAASAGTTSSRPASSAAVVKNVWTDGAAARDALSSGSSKLAAAAVASSSAASSAAAPSAPTRRAPPRPSPVLTAPQQQQQPQSQQAQQQQQHAPAPFGGDKSPSYAAIAAMGAKKSAADSPQKQHCNTITLACTCYTPACKAKQNNSAAHAMLSVPHFLFVIRSTVCLCVCVCVYMILQCDRLQVCITIAAVQQRWIPTRCVEQPMLQMQARHQPEVLEVENRRFTRFSCAFDVACRSSCDSNTQVLSYPFLNRSCKQKSIEPNGRVLPYRTFAATR